MSAPSDTAVEARHEPAITASLFFTEEEVASVDWDAVFRGWDFPDRREDPDRHYGAIYPSVLFDEETAREIDWKSIYGF